MGNHAVIPVIYIEIP